MLLLDQTIPMRLFVVVEDSHRERMVVPTRQSTAARFCIAEDRKYYPYLCFIQILPSGWSLGCKFSTRILYIFLVPESNLRVQSIHLFI